MSKPGAAVNDELGARAAGLVHRIAAGEQAAESELVATYGRGLLYLLRHLTRDPTLAEDLHQETLRVVLEKARAGGIERPESLAGFVRATARNLFFTEIRKRSRRGRSEVEGLETEPVDPQPNPFVRLVLAEDRQRVRRLLAELPRARDREVLFRFYLAEESKESICADLRLDAQHFNLVLFRARQRFRRLIEAAGSERANPGVKE